MKLLIFLSAGYTGITINNGWKCDLMLNVIDIQNKIRAFESTINSNLTEENMNRKLLQLCEGIGIPESGVTWDKTNRLYRARILGSTDLNELKKWKQGDFWGVPKEKISSYGRLNGPHESIFYLSNEPKQTLKEVRFEQFRNFPIVISCFRIKCSFNSVHIGGAAITDSPGENPIIPIVQNLYTDFFRNQFSKPVGKGTEYLYLLSNAIAKDFYDLPYEISKAWTYSAIENHNAFNVAFRSEVASDFLKFGGAIVAKVTGNNQLEIPICFDANYQICLPNRSWIQENFNLNYQAK